MSEATETLPGAIPDETPAEGATPTAEQSGEALLKALKSERDERKKLEAELKKFTAAEQERAETAKRAELEAKGEYEQALEAFKAKHAATISDLETQLNAVVLDAKFTAAAMAAGASQEQAQDLFRIAQSRLRRNGMDVEVLGNDGKLTADGLDDLMTELKTAKPYMFGSPAPRGAGIGGKPTGTNGKTTITRAEFAAMQPAAQMKAAAEMRAGTLIISE